MRTRFSKLLLFWTNFQQQTFSQTYDELPSITNFKIELLPHEVKDEFNRKNNEEKINQIIFPENELMKSNLSLELGRFMIYVGVYYNEEISNYYFNLFLNNNDNLEISQFNWTTSKSIKLLSPNNDLYIKKSKILISPENINALPNKTDLDIKSIFEITFSKRNFITEKLES